MFRPHCGHLQGNIYRLSAFNVHTIWDPIVCTIVQVCNITTIKTYLRIKYDTVRLHLSIVHTCTIVHTMGSHTVCTLKALNLYMLA